jgi:hypothetical protein
MTQEHPITPPPDLMEHWLGDFWPQDALVAAAQWGADEELETCCKMLYDRYDRVRHATGFPGSDMSDWLRAARRPKTASLKEKALEAVKQIPVEPDSGPWRTAMETIILALHQLPDND